MVGNIFHRRNKPLDARNDWPAATLRPAYHGRRAADVQPHEPARSRWSRQRNRSRPVLPGKWSALAVRSSEQMSPLLRHDSSASGNTAEVDSNKPLRAVGVWEGQKNVRNSRLGLQSLHWRQLTKARSAGIDPESWSWWVLPCQLAPFLWQKTVLLTDGLPTLQPSFAPFQNNPTSQQTGLGCAQNGNPGLLEIRPGGPL